MYVSSNIPINILKVYFKYKKNKEEHLQQIANKESCTHLEFRDAVILSSLHV